MLRKRALWTEQDSVTTGELDNLSQASYSAYYQSEAVPLEDIARTIVYSGDNVARIEDRAGGVLRREISYTYSGDNLTGKTVKVFDADGQTIMSQYTDSYGYVGDSITSHTRTVVV